MPLNLLSEKKKSYPFLRRSGKVSKLCFVRRGGVGCSKLTPRVLGELNHVFQKRPLPVGPRGKKCTRSQ